MNRVIIRPSSLISNIKLEKVNQHTLFKFSDELQWRMEELLARKKADILTSEEMGEDEKLVGAGLEITYVSNQ